MDSLWFSGCLINKAGFFKTTQILISLNASVYSFLQRTFKGYLAHMVCHHFVFLSSAVGFYLLNCINEATLRYINAINKTNNVG